MSDPSDISSQPSLATKRSSGYSFTFSLRSVIGVIAVIILCAASFFGGVAYQKGHAPKVSTTTAATSGGGFGGFGGNGGRRLGAIGQVTAVSATSITINNQRSGSSATYTITGSTTITDNGQTVSASNIQTGDTVLITVASSGSATATRIVVNPSFGSFSGPSSGQ